MLPFYNAWMHHENIMLNERNQTQKASYCIRLYNMPRTGKAVETGSSLWFPGAGGRGQGVTAHGGGVSFCGDENVLELDRGDRCMTY